MTSRLSRLTYDYAAEFFDAAMIGLESRQAKSAAKREQAKADARTVDFNELVDAVKRGVAACLDVDAQEVVVFHNTTAAVERVIQRVCQEMHHARATLLTTDLEYPGIMAHLDEAWPGRLAVAEVSPLLWRGAAEDVPAQLLEAVLLTRPEVIYLSHIARASGYRLPDEIFARIRQINPRAVIICDGAQAVGNIKVTSEFLRNVDFYVTSGQKWLGGRPSLGLVYARREWVVDDPAQGYSKKLGSGGTGSVDALASLSLALSEFVSEHHNDTLRRVQEVESHNQILAKQLCEQLTGLNSVYTLPAINKNWDYSGIVTIVPLGSTFLDFGRSSIKWSPLHQEPWRTDEGHVSSAPRFYVSLHRFDEGAVVEICRLRDRATSVPPRGALRVCLHHYHGSQDVDHLVNEIKRVVRVRGRSLRKRAAAIRKAVSAITGR